MKLASPHSMSIRNLDAIFKPKSIAIIGASTHENSIGNNLIRNLLRAGFEGQIFPVNPAHNEVCGRRCFPDTASLPDAPDLAVICTPPSTVPDLIASLGRRGTKGAVVISAGFKEMQGAEGAALEHRMLDEARPHLLRVIGPNCIGVLSTPAKLNASFAHIQPEKGGLAFVSQSGAMLTTILDWAATRKVGFSHMVSLGDMADVDLGDMLDYLAMDSATSAILLYVEAVTQARKFMSAARAASRLKPVIVIKSGRHTASAKAASSHTGALAGVDAVYDAAFRRAGILRVGTLEELFDAAEILDKPHLPQGERIAILTNGGGVGVLATDALLDLHARLAGLSAQTVERLGAVLPRTWSHSNPVDIIGDAMPARYAAALEILLGAPEVDWVMVQHCPTAVSSGLDIAQQVVKTARAAGKIVLANWLDCHASEEIEEIFAHAGCPSYSTPEEAARGFSHVMRFRHAQEALLEAPAAELAEFEPARSRAAQIVGEAANRGESWLAFPTVRDILRCYGINTPRTAFAASIGELEVEAKKLKAPFVLKIQSPGIVHKSDVGGVAGGLRDVPAVVNAAKVMMETVRRRVPGAEVSGFILQETVASDAGIEMITGMTIDQTFGPVLLFGQGGKAVEVINDKALALPPLNPVLAHEMMERTRIYSQLRGYRDQRPIDTDGIATTLVKLSMLVCDIREIAEIEINPLVSTSGGMVAIDARLRLRSAAEQALPHLAVCPYPHILERFTEHPQLGRLLIRPIRPDDATIMRRMFDRLSPEDVRSRFFCSMRALSGKLMSRLTQIDYDREMAFLLLDSGGENLAVGRLCGDPDGVEAEFAILVRGDMQRRGLGSFMLQSLLDYARERRLQRIYGDVHSDNAAMRELCVKKGFNITFRNVPGLVRATLDLAAIH